MILICPECKYPVNFHGENDVDSTAWIRLLSGDNDAECKLSEVEATHSAQRAAAIAHLRFLGKSVLFWLSKIRESPDNRSYRRIYFDAVSEVNHAFAAYRAVGILKAPKP